MPEYSSPNYVSIGVAKKTHPSMAHECCDVCARQVWIPPSAVKMLEDAEYRGDRSTVVCIGHGLAEFGRLTVAQILCHQNEDLERL